METLKNSHYFVQSLAKGLYALQALSEAGRPLSLSDIAKELGTTNTTATRLCYTLGELGFIQRNAHRQYFLTPTVLTLGYSAICSLDVREIARYYLECLFEEVQENVNLSILEGPEILFILRLRKGKYLPFDIRIGMKLPVYCTAMGKVLLAMGPREKTSRILKKLEFRPITTHTITNPEEFLEELKRVRERGYSLSNEELSIGGLSVAAPVVDGRGNAVAAINITVSTSKYNIDEVEQRLAPHIMETAKDISKALLEIEYDSVLDKSF